MTTLHTCNKNDYLIFLFTFFLLQFTLIFFHQNFILIQSTIPKIYSITIYYINIFTNTTTWLYIYCEKMKKYLWNAGTSYFIDALTAMQACVGFFGSRALVTSSPKLILYQKTRFWILDFFFNILNLVNLQFFSKIY